MGGKMKRICLLVVCSCVVTGTSPACATIVYGVGSFGSEGVYVVDTDAITTTLLFATPGIIWYGATDGDNTTTFFATPDGGSLYRIDVVSNTATAIGTFGGAQINGLAYNESDGVLYGTDNANLYSIDIASGTPTLIGSLNGPEAVWAIDYDASIDKLVAVNNDNESMYYVDMITGNATLVGSTGQTRITDIWYDTVSGSMFGVGSYPHRLFSIDTATGAATTIGTIDEALTGLGNPIPEPASIFLLALAGLALRREHRKLARCRKCARELRRTQTCGGQYPHC